MKTRIATYITFAFMLFFAASCGDSLTSIDDQQETLTELALLQGSPTMEQKLRGIWIIGGAADIAGTSIISQIDLYDPVTNTWYPNVAASASGTYVPTAFNSAAYLNGKIYVMGGAANAGATTFTVSEYNIANNSWTAKQNIQYTGVDTALMDATAYTYTGSIYLIGGTTTTTTACIATAYHIRFDPAAGSNGTWYNTPPAVYTTARSSMGASCIGGITYFFGGRIAGGAGQTTNDAYIIATNAYSATVETVISARGGMAYAYYSGTNGTNIFIVGGASAFLAVTGYFSATPTYVPQASCFQIYTPGGGVGTVTNGKFHPAFSGGVTTGIVYAGAAVSPYNGSSASDPTLYVFGGIKNQITVTNEVCPLPPTARLAGILQLPGIQKQPCRVPGSAIA